MTGDFTVFAASPSDGDVVGEIHVESWKAAYAGFFEPEFFAEALRHRRHKWHDVIAASKNAVLLAALDGRPLAFSYLGPSPVRQGSAELFGFYAHPDGWGSGIAQVLMVASLNKAREDGFQHVHLWTLRDTAQSRRFYTKCGFAESGTTRSYDLGDGNPLQQVEYEVMLS
ncbi:GNAT family N-acetyltransferase [Actinomadura sp. NBRC 104412]|uniref:GNAT family N-acetyltransferase n=1 Tax=Actinomadura sp. NBRC 104412 TaxID=3032203 RepID=UPI002556C8B9|nr:GNAT family N-acetyltransferase [Actinomadura sp. NBRC 104412]